MSSNKTRPHPSKDNQDPSAKASPHGGDSLCPERRCYTHLSYGVRQTIPTHDTDVGWWSCVLGVVFIYRRDGACDHRDAVPTLAERAHHLVCASRSDGAVGWIGIRNHEEIHRSGMFLRCPKKPERGRHQVHVSVCPCSMSQATREQAHSPGRRMGPPRCLHNGLRSASLLKYWTTQVSLEL